jgi:hypothetical protein
MCESFFVTLECELIDRRRFRSHSEARMAVFHFIEGFYNPSRRHSALGYLSPASLPVPRRPDSSQPEPRRLSGADLTGAVSLGQEQLGKACGSHVKLPTRLTLSRARGRNGPRRYSLICASRPRARGDSRSTIVQASRRPR